MRDYYELGSAPANEPCISVSKTEDYYPLMRQEVTVYRRMLERAFPETPGGVCFSVKANPHEFGTYCEVRVIFDGDDEEESEFACKVENQIPTVWDEQAKEELKLIQNYNPR